MQGKRIGDVEKGGRWLSVEQNISQYVNLPQGDEHSKHVWNHYPVLVTCIMTKNGTPKGPVCFLFAEYVVWDFGGWWPISKEKNMLQKHPGICSINTD